MDELREKVWQDIYRAVARLKVIGGGEVIIPADWDSVFRVEVRSNPDAYDGYDTEVTLTAKG